MSGDDCMWVHVKNLQNNKAYAIRSTLLYRWIDENTHEPFDPDKFEKGTNYCVYFGGVAVRHSAYAIAETKAALYEKLNLEKGNHVLRGVTIAPRKSLTSVQSSNLKAQANNLVKKTKQTAAVSTKSGKKHRKNSIGKGGPFHITVHTDGENEGFTTKKQQVEDDKENPEHIQVKKKRKEEASGGDAELRENSEQNEQELASVRKRSLDSEPMDWEQLDEDVLPPLGSGKKTKSFPERVQADDSTLSTCVVSTPVLPGDKLQNTPRKDVIPTTSPAQEIITNTVDSHPSDEPQQNLKEDMASVLSRVGNLEKESNEIKKMCSKILDVVTKLHKNQKKCRVAELERAVEGYEDVEVPDGSVLVGHVDDKLKFICKKELVRIEKEFPQLKGRILELGKQFYGDCYYKYSLVGTKEGRSSSFKIEPEHLLGMAKLLQSLHWVKPEDLSTERISRLVGKYFSSDRKAKESVTLITNFKNLRTSE